MGATIVKRPASPLFCRILLVLTIVALYLPLISLGAGALRDQSGWGLGSFVAVLQNPYWMEALQRSLVLGVGSALLSSVLGFLAALSVLAVRKSRLLPSLLSVAMVMPEIVFALILLIWFSSLGLSLGLWTVLISHMTFSISFAYLILRNRLEGLDPLIFEAAADLGAKPVQTLFKVILPVMLPTLGASTVICFLLSFDDFLISFFVNGVGQDTLPIKLYASMKIGMTPETNALAVMMCALSALVLVLISRSGAVRSMIQKQK